MLHSLPHRCLQSFSEFEFDSGPTVPTHQGVECHVLIFNQGPDICILTLELNALISSCFERMEWIAIMAHITLDPFKQLGVESQPHTLDKNGSVYDPAGTESCDMHIRLVI